MRKHLIGWFIVLASVMSMQAQTSRMSVVSVQAQSSRWENLDQIHRGAKIDVVEQSLKSISGKFVRVSQDDLTLDVQGKEVTIQKEQVYRVSVVATKRKRNALIGLAAGAGVGAGAGAALMEREPGYGGAVAGTTVGFAAIGAGIGALIPSTSTKTVYMAEAPKQASLKAQVR